MRVLLIDINCQGSSTGKIVYDLCTSLRKDGHEAAICYGRGDVVDEENIFKFGLDLETNIHAGLARITGLNGYFSPLSTKRLLNFIDEFSPDMVHIHELHAYFVNFKPLLSYLKRKKIKVVWTFHCEYMYTGKCGHAYECENWKNECGNCPAVKNYPKSLLLDFTKKMLRDKKEALRGLDLTIVTPSSWLADRVRMSFLKDKDIRVIYNGVDTETVFFPRQQNQISELKEKYKISGKKIVLSVAPKIMSDNKGGHIVLEVSKHFVEKNTHFVIIGVENNEVFEKDNVLVLPRTADQNELALWYSAADMFLICSKRETFSMTCAEALCCGTPVCGFKNGASETVFTEPYSTFYEYGDIDALVNAIDARLTVEKQADVISEIGRSSYSRFAMYKSYLTLYESGKKSECGGKL